MKSNKVVSKSELFSSTIRLCCDRPGAFATAEATLLTLTWLEDKLLPQRLTSDMSRQWERSRPRSSGNFPQQLSNSREPRLDIDMFGGMWTVQNGLSLVVGSSELYPELLSLERGGSKSFKSQDVGLCKHTKQRGGGNTSQQYHVLLDDSPWVHKKITDNIFLSSDECRVIIIIIII